MYVLGILLVVFLGILDVVVCQASPCPDVFQFRYGSDGLSGYIKVLPSNFSKNVDLSISFAASMDFPQDGAWVLEPINQVSSHAINLGVPLWYRVKFPAGSSVPELTSLLVNDVELCPGVNRSANTNGVTLRHSAVLDRGSGSVSPLTPSPFHAGPGPVINNGLLQIINHYHFNSPQDYQSHSFPHEFFTPRPGLSPRPQFRQPVRTYGPPWVQTSTPRPPPPTTRPPEPAPLYGECGISNNDDNQTLILNGGTYERGDWPWLTALYKRRNGRVNFVCSGTLVSNRHVVTAAQCMQKKNTYTSYKDMVVKIGVFNLEDWGEEFTVTRTLTAAAIHDKYNSHTLANDILMMTLDRTVEFNAYIRPLCLWSGNTDLDRIVGSNGVVAGWGKSEDGPGGEGLPKFVKMPIVSTSTCRASMPDFHKLTSSNTLCAGARNGAGPCKGDSGAGLYVSENRRWQLRGVVSLSLRPENEDSTSCNLIVFTDAAKYLTWIKGIMEQ